jgi:hypothetical protein
MTLPLRKDDAENRELTTADLARTKDRGEDPAPEVEPDRMKPVRSDRFGSDTSNLRQGNEVVMNRQSAASTSPEATPLFPEEELGDLQGQWNDIQTGFVDEPRSAVQRADSLVASTMQKLADAFARERSKLEQQWDQGDSVSTEDLRVAFQRYRSFFLRLLSFN